MAASGSGPEDLHESADRLVNSRENFEGIVELADAREGIFSDGGNAEEGICGFLKRVGEDCQGADQFGG